MSLDAVERALLWSAVEDTTWLIEFRRGVDMTQLDGPLIRDRAAMGKALLSLLSRNLIVIGTSRWNEPTDASVAPIGEMELRARLTDGSAWDPDRKDLIVMDATQSAQDLLVPPAEAERG